MELVAVSVRKQYLAEIVSGRGGGVAPLEFSYLELFRP